MIKKASVIAAVLFFFSIDLAFAQFINLRIRVEPELSATVEQSLDFGTQIANSGEVSVGLGDISMGVFSIRAYHTQNIYINLSYPDYLVNDNSAIDDRIPLHLSIAYNNSGSNNPSNATILTGNNGLITVHEATSQRSENSKIWEILYSYLYGSIDIGSISNGYYSGDVVLSVDYD